MSKPKRLTEYIRLGLTRQQSFMLFDLTNRDGSSPQMIIANLIVKAFDELQETRKRLGQPISRAYTDSEIHTSSDDDGMVSTEELEEEYRREHPEKFDNNITIREEKPKRKSGIEIEPQQQERAWAFKFRTSPALKRKIWGSIAIVEPHLVVDYSKDKNVRILRTKEEVKQAKKELNEIFEFVDKKKRELDKKFGRDRNNPEWIQAWGKIDP